MAYSYQDIAASNGQDTFTFSVPYLNRPHISVLIDSVLEPAEDWNFTGAFTIVLDVPIVGAGHTVRIKRTTPIDEPIVDYANGSVLGESQLDASAQQAVFAAQETADLIEEIGLAGAEGAAQIAALQAAASAAAAAGSRTGAETAETNAELAETNAETALTAALAAQTAAELAEAHAETAETNAELAETNAETAETNAETAEANAETAQAAAEAAQAAAEAAAAVIATGVQAYTSTDTLDDGVGTALLSGASFTFTLTTAVGVAGKIVTIRHGGTSLTQVYTIDTTSSQTIAACDGTTTSYVLYTNGEILKLVSDGSNWQVLDHVAETGWTNSGAWTIEAVSGNPTKATSPTVDELYWKRSGNMVSLRGCYYKASTATGSAAGTGNYLFGLPANITLNTTVHPVATGTVIGENTRAVLDSNGAAGVDGSQIDAMQAVVYSSTQFRLMDATAAQVFVTSTVYPTTGAGTSYGVVVRATAANWRA